MDALLVAIDFGGDLPSSYSMLSYTKGNLPKGQLYVGELLKATHPKGYTYDRESGDLASFASVSTNPRCACSTICLAQ